MPYYRVVEDAGCALGCLLLIVAPAVVFIIFRVRSGAAAEAGRLEQASAAAAATRQEQLTRGVRITKLLRMLPGTLTPEAVLEELHEVLRSGPIGFVPELTASEGWFAQSSTVLRALFLKQNARATAIVDMYFQCFTFPSSHQKAVLLWLNDSLSGVTEPVREELFKRVAERVLEHSDPAEADWLYRRALEKVRDTNGAPAFKAVALHIGRMRYAAARPERQPTVYDEQAIANDIATSVQ